MTSKKYYTYSEKEKICAIQKIKDSIIALERDVTKIHQNLKSIGQEKYYLYDVMIGSFETTSFSELSESSLSKESREKEKLDYYDETVVAEKPIYKSKWEYDKKECDNVLCNPGEYPDLDD
ncbi:hypothetical protein C1645_734696 [Glomus cerebriforme]|uniref:Uncharacterized protein n=1 Tax=Glomus cerebriforme TaxID=658196 RepID=A0A397TB35_9GLOM|nr:hypothetical protein C1645_734696 [Glomus cerebriforme]